MRLFSTGQKESFAGNQAAVAAVQQTGRFALFLLLAMLPFELQRPLLVLGPLQLTNVEMALSLVLLCAGTLLLLGHKFVAPPRWWGWLALFCLSALLSALVAPALQANALKAALRLLAGVLLGLAVPQLICTKRHIQQAAAVLLVAGSLTVLIGYWEMIAQQPLFWLGYLRPKITVVGQFFRLTGPFDYANQTAMFLEGTLFFWVAWLGVLLARTPTTARKKGWILLSASCLVIYLQAAFLTFSRASWGTVLVVSLLFSAIAAARALRCRRATDSSITGLLRRDSRFMVWALLVAAVMALFCLNVLFSPVFRLRLQNESDHTWYQFELQVRDHLIMTAGETAFVPLALQNSGKLSWDSTVYQPVNLGARWVTAQGAEEYGQPRWPLPRPIHPGDGITWEVPLRAPAEPGDYLLHWDLVQEGVVWFGEKNGRQTTTSVLVQSSPTPLPEDNEMRSKSVPVEFSPPIPGRRVLWKVASRLWFENPLTGIGLDNFRLSYGSFLDMDSWNETVHTNNWYLEFLVSLGISGAVPFFIWLSLLVKRSSHWIWPEPASWWATAVLAALLSFLLHGLLDFFLLFNATGLLFWFLIGLWHCFEVGSSPELKQIKRSL